MRISYIIEEKYKIQQTVSVHQHIYSHYDNEASIGLRHFWLTATVYITASGQSWGTTVA